MIVDRSKKNSSKEDVIDVNVCLVYLFIGAVINITISYIIYIVASVFFLLLSLIGVNNSSIILITNHLIKFVVRWYQFLQING
jgi:hypothetical protein